MGPGTKNTRQSSQRVPPKGAASFSLTARRTVGSWGLALKGRFAQIFFPFTFFHIVLFEAQNSWIVPVSPHHSIWVYSFLKQLVETTCGAVPVSSIFSFESQLLDWRWNRRLSWGGPLSRWANVMPMWSCGASDNRDLFPPLWAQYSLNENIIDILRSLESTSGVCFLGHSNTRANAGRTDLCGPCPNRSSFSPARGACAQHRPWILHEIDDSIIIVSPEMGMSENPEASRWMPRILGVYSMWNHVLDDRMGFHNWLEGSSWFGPIQILHRFLSRVSNVHDRFAFAPRKSRDSSTGHSAWEKIWRLTYPKCMKWMANPPRSLTWSTSSPHCQLFWHVLSWLLNFIFGFTGLQSRACLLLSWSFQRSPLCRVDLRLRPLNLHGMCEILRVLEGWGVRILCCMYL